MQSSLDLESSVSEWLDQLKNGDESAVCGLWKRYFRLLVAHARQKLARSRHLDLSEDEEDIAQSVFQRFCRAAQQGRFPNLNDRNDLWRVLVYLTSCRVADRHERNTALKRMSDRVVRECEIPAGSGAEDLRWLEQLACGGPTPEFAAETAEECERLLGLLGDERLRRIALLKLACFSHEEISNELGCSLRTVTLKIKLIRKHWEREL